MDASLVVTWSHVLPGREMKAMQYAMEVDEFWAKLAAEGKCTAPEWFFSTLGHNIWMVKGDLETLRAIEDTDEAKMMNEKGFWLLADFGLEYYLTGAAAAASNEWYIRAGQELELV